MRVNVQLLHVPSYVEYVISESAANYARHYRRKGVLKPIQPQK